MRRLAPAALLLAVAVAGCGIAGTAKIEAPVSVYVSLPLTGPHGADGRNAADGARLALEEARGKAGSIQVRAVYLDDAKGKVWDPVAVGANARRAVQDSSAAAYIGELDSEPTRASMPITNDAGLIQVSPGAGGVDLTEPATGYPNAPDEYRPSGNVTFARTVPSDDVVTRGAAEWASELGAQRAVVLMNGSPFEDLMATEFKSDAAERGIEASIATGSYSFPGGPAAGGAEAEAGAVVAAYIPRDQRLRVSSQLRLLGGGAGGDPSNLPGGQFAAQFEERFHRPPGPYAAYGYEAMQLVLQAIRGAGSGAPQVRDNGGEEVIGAPRAGTVLGSYPITSDRNSTECMIQRYRV